MNNVVDLHKWQAKIEMEKMGVDMTPILMELIQSEFKFKSSGMPDSNDVICSVTGDFKGETASGMPIDTTAEYLMTSIDGELAVFANLGFDVVYELDFG